MTLADVKFVEETKIGWGWSNVEEAVKVGENIFTATYTGVDAENYTVESRTAEVTFTVGRATIKETDFEITSQAST